MKHKKPWQGSIALCLSLITFSLGHSQTISFNGTVQPGSTINVTGVANETISIYSFAANPINCNNPTVAGRVAPLNFAAVGAVPAGPTYSLQSSAATITLAAPPLAAGTFLCLRADFTPSGGAPNGAVVVSNPPAPVVVPPAAPSISIQGSPSAGAASVSVLSSVQADVGIIAFPYQFGGAMPAGSCTAANVASSAASPLQISLGGTPVAAVLVPAGTAQTITLVNSLPAGARLCAVANPPLGVAGAPAFSPFVDVQAAAGPPSPSVNGTLVTTSASPTTAISVYGQPGASMAIFQLNDQDNGLGCEGAIIAGKGTQLQIAAAGSTAAPTLSAALGAGPGPFAITLSSSNPLVAGTDICLEQTMTPVAGAGPAAPQYSSVPVLVQDGDNPVPRLRTFYTAGAMINNENGSSTSTTGAEYLDIGLDFTLLGDVGKWHSNWTNSISGRFSSIPVTAPSTTPAAGSGTPSSTGTLNILSSQETFRVLGAAALTWGEGPKTQVSYYQFFSGPVAKAGMDTLLNPSATASSGASGSATAVAQFAPVYTEYSAGWRIGYRHFNLFKDPSPRTVAQVDITIGKFSNLQSFVCNSKVTTTATSQPTNTSCYTPQTPNASSYTLDQQSRITLLRPEINGLVNLGGGKSGSGNFVLGLDANLPQSVDAPANLDVLNKAGGSVIIYFGYSGSLTALFNQLLPGH